MPRSLVVPGVSIATQFDVAPPLPARSGILGAVGVVDRSPGDGPQGVSTAQELLELFGPATRYSFPEALSALSNGVSQVIISPVDARSGKAAELILKDDDGDDVVILRARAAGPWGNELSVRITRAMGGDNRTVLSVSCQVLYKGRPIENHNNLIFWAGDARDFFSTLNRDSGVIVAIDPAFQADLPVFHADARDLSPGPAQPAKGALSRGGASIISLATTAPGAGGNRVSLEVVHGHAVAELKDANKTVLRVRARKPGPDGIKLGLRVTNGEAGGINVEVQGTTGDLRTYKGLKDASQLASALSADPELIVDSADALPVVTPARVFLEETRTVIVREENLRTRELANLQSPQAIADALNATGLLTATPAQGIAANHLPDATPANAHFLSGGRDAGHYRTYRGQLHPNDDILALLPAEGTEPSLTRVQVTSGSRAQTVKITTSLQVGDESQEREVFDDLSMDPDSERYLPSVLEQSSLVRAVVLHEREHTTTAPVATGLARSLTGGEAPSVEAYKAAIDALATEETVDMVLAGLQEWRDKDLDGHEVHQALLAHALTQSDNARPRIALGSVSPPENTDIKAMLNHAGRVGSRRFVLVAPSGAEGAIAGLLGHLEFFQSATFKPVASPGVPLPRYSDSDLDKLVGPTGNLCVIQQRRGIGTVCIKGIATSGDQISVTRVADRCVREAKAISDRFIGELNNADSRNALKQMIIATFAQLERDGALVPSVDGKSPAFLVEVYASQNDTAGGIVRIDLAVRPVRAIDYIYVTLRVKN